MKTVSSPFAVTVHGSTPSSSVYVGPSNTPTLWSLELTSDDVIRARAGYNILSTNGYPHNREYLQDPTYGFHYLRFTNNPDAIDGGYAGYNNGSSIIGWFIPSAPDGPYRETDVLYVRYMMFIEDDVAAGFNELGMKLPGPSSETGFSWEKGGLMSWRTWHAAPINNTYLMNNYRYDTDTGTVNGGYPVMDTFQTPVAFKTNHWYVVEVGCSLNSVVNGIAQADGWGAVWVDGTKVLELNNHKFRDDPLTKIRTFFVNVYHGGMTNPIGVFHYRLAKLASSASYIGVPSELLT